MVERRRAAAGDAARFGHGLRGGARVSPVSPEQEAAVREIVARVAEEGEAAVLDYTRRWDTAGAQPFPLRVDELELRGALEALDAPLRDALETAAGNIRAVAMAGVASDREVELPQGQRVILREVPVRRAAIYVPGGRAPYPSTVLMGALAAEAAGVEQIVVCTPPGPDGDADRVVLAACALCGVGEVYRMGGAQAVAALALGTAGIPRVDVIVGPGNVFVQEAKRQLSAVVGIDGFAGPSEVLIVLSDDADPRLAALDLLAQAEHGPESVAIAVSPSGAVLDAVAAALERAAPPGETAPSEDAAEVSGGPEPSGGAAGDATALGTISLVEVADLDDALALSEAFAPEHLQLMGSGAEALAPQVRAAGCLFVGAAGGTAFGDYVAGSNHVLPTGGAARFASTLSPRHFRRRMSEVHIGPGAATLAAPGAAIARAEGFVRHAESMQARLEDWDRR